MSLDSTILTFYCLFRMPAKEGNAGPKLNGKVKEEDGGL